MSSPSCSPTPHRPPRPAFLSCKKTYCNDTEWSRDPYPPRSQLVRGHLAQNSRASPPAVLYAALYSTLQARWARQAEDLEAHNELARVLVKRGRAVDVEKTLEITAFDAEAESGLSVSEPVMDSMSMETRTALKRRRADYVTTTHTSMQGLLVTADEVCMDESEIETERVPKRHRRTSSPPFPSPPPPLAISSNFTANVGGETTLDLKIPSKMERVEQLLRVLRSFEAVLGNRAQAWRAIQSRIEEP